MDNKAKIRVAYSNLDLPVATKGQCGHWRALSAAGACDAEFETPGSTA